MAQIYRLPPELLKMITDNLDFTSFLCFKVASKTIAHTVYKIPRPETDRWVQAHTVFEAMSSRRRSILVCTRCAKLLPPGDFSDSQARKSCPRRFCVTCGIRGSRYSPKRSFKQGGVKVFGCPRCNKGIPVTHKHWVLKGGHRWCKPCFRTMLALGKCTNWMLSGHMVNTPLPRWWRTL